MTFDSPQMTLELPQIDSDDTWVTSDWVRWHLTHLRLSQMTFESPQIESYETWLTSDWAIWHLTHIRLSQMTLVNTQYNKPINFFFFFNRPIWQKLEKENPLWRPLMGKAERRRRRSGSLCACAWWGAGAVRRGSIDNFYLSTGLSWSPGWPWRGWSWFRCELGSWDELWLIFQLIAVKMCSIKKKKILGLFM